MTAPPECRPTPAGGVRSVLTALDVLDCFAEDPELGVTEIARRLGVAKSTAHRLLRTLCERGLAGHDPATGHYRLGMHLVELGQLAKERAPMHRGALPVLEHLRAVTGRIVQLGVADGPDVLFLERLDTRGGRSPGGDLGSRRVPAHACSAGKVLAAYDPVLEQARLAAGFPALTPRTLTGAAEFRAALAQVRRTGFAVADGEAVAGLASVSVPVRDRSHRTAAALSLAGPAEELLPSIGHYVEILGAAAIRLAHPPAADPRPAPGG